LLLGEPRSLHQVSLSGGLWPPGNSYFTRFRSVGQRQQSLARLLFESISVNLCLATPGGKQMLAQ
jgi:hypothetical protein